MTNQKVRTGATKQVFKFDSPGFIYSAIVSVLTVLALAGVKFPENPEQIAGEINTLIGSGGFFALIGVAVSSIAFPIWNAYQKKNLSIRGIWKNTLTWVAFAVLLFDGLALIGLNFPEGTAQNLVYYIFAKDWTALFSMIVTVIIPTVVRFIKDKNTAS